jgi:hypothetical protein
MKKQCPHCGLPDVAAPQPCPSCGLVQDPRSLFFSPAMSGFSRASRATSGAPEIRLSPFRPGTTLDKEHYLLLEPQRVQQWGAEAMETRWLAQETDLGTGHQRSVILVDVALPTYDQCQSVSRAARRAFMGNGSSTLLHAFLEQKHCLFVFADGPGGSLQERIDRRLLLSEAEAKSCLQALARAILRLSQLDPPVMHGWICPAHVVQRGAQWHVLPGSGLVAGEATRFANIQAPGRMGDGSFRPETDLFSAFQTVYAGLTGLMPPPASGNQRLPSLVPRMSAAFAAILAHGLQAGFHTPTDLLAAWGEQDRVGSHPHRSSRLSGSLTPTIPPQARPVHASRSHVGGSREHTEAEPRSDLQEEARSVSGEKTLKAYPFAPDARHAWYWGSGILVAELVVLFFSR